MPQLKKPEPELYYDFDDSVSYIMKKYKYRQKDISDFCDYFLLKHNYPHNGSLITIYDDLDDEDENITDSIFKVYKNFLTEFPDGTKIHYWW